MVADDRKAGVGLVSSCGSQAIQSSLGNGPVGLLVAYLLPLGHAAAASLTPPHLPPCPDPQWL